MSNLNKKLVFTVTELEYFCSHRLALALAAKEAGYQVTLVEASSAAVRPKKQTTDGRQRELF